MLTLHDLFDDQLEAIEFINDGEDALLCADVGTGKTTISLTAAHNAIENNFVKRWLVIAPKLVATSTWANESAEWEHLHNEAVAIACGDEGTRIKAIESDAPIVVINYENLPWLMQRYKKVARKPDPLPFDALILDEIDKMKTVSAERFKDFRNRIKIFQKRIGLTGTILPTRLEEIWAQIFLIDGGDSFGRSFYKWRKEHFYPTDFKQYAWAPFPGTREYILDTLADLTYRLKAKGISNINVLDPNYMDLPELIQERYKKLDRDFYLKTEKDSVTAVNSGVLVGKLQQICAGFSYGDGKKIIRHAGDKFDKLRDDIHRICADQDDQLLVVYHFREELAQLQEIVPTLHYIGGGVSDRQAQKNIEYWNNRDINIMAIHFQSAGHGLNLQKSHAHEIEYLTLPWSGGMWRQVNGRLARRGNKSPFVNVRTNLYRDTIDERVFEVVSERVADMDGFLDDLERKQTGKEMR